MHTSDDLSNRRIRQLIEQFNAEEAYGGGLRSALQGLRKLIASNAGLADPIAALRKARWSLPKPPPVNAVGFCVEDASSDR